MDVNNIELPESLKEVLWDRVDTPWCHIYYMYSACNY